MDVVVVERRARHRVEIGVVGIHGDEHAVEHAHREAVHVLEGPLPAAGERRI